MKFRFFNLRSAAAALALLGPSGCETVPMEPSPDFVPDMVVATDYAQFFKLGPQQAGGADFSLRAGETVMLQRKEFGYSRVQLENNLVGYMANEDITPAPPPEKLKPGKRKKADRSGSTTGSSSRSRSQSAPEPEDFEDLPISDLNLDILPEDVPLEPLPDLLPEPPPQAPAPAPAPAPEPTPIKESIPEVAPDTAPVSTST
jgi:hypothetical protein